MWLIDSIIAQALYRITGEYDAKQSAIQNKIKEASGKRDEVHARFV
jgi:hypothetical protein